MLKISASLLSLLALCSCQTAYEALPSVVGEANIVDPAGTSIGTARLVALGDQVSINVALQGSAAGVHGMHLHETGNCSAAGFTSAGGHLNPERHQHGTLNPQGSHLGDLPNITLSAAGVGTASATLTGTRDSLLGHIFDADGTAIVVHASADDYRTDPAGAAGGRIACGVFVRK